jgi:hypothetical protein
VGLFIATAQRGFAPVEPQPPTWTVPVVVGDNIQIKAKAFSNNKLNNYTDDCGAMA